MAYLKTTAKIVICLSLLLMLCAEAYAQEQEQMTTEPAMTMQAAPADEEIQQAPSAPEAEAEPVGEVQLDANGVPAQNRVLSPIEQKMSVRVSPNYRDMPIETVLSQLADQAGVNIIVSPEVQGNVTVSLKDVPLYEALTNILAIHNYGYVTTENMIRVVPRDQLAVEAQKMISRVYHITYADVKEVAKALQSFISKGGEMAVNPGTSHIMITDTEQKINSIDSFIAELDKPTQQVLIEARFYDVTYTDNLDLGVQWQVGSNTNFLIDDDAINGIGQYPAAEGALGTIQKQNPAISKLDPFYRGVQNSAVDKTESSDNSFRFGILNGSVDIDMLLRAEQEDITATLLANPRVRVLDNEKALFDSIREIPYQELQETAAGGSIGTTNFKEVGVKLVVVPHVARDGMIRVNVKPEFSVEAGSVLVPAGNTFLPQPVINKRSADTTLLVKSGQTIVLGGLRKKEVSMQTNKIPLLGDIPVIGLLFKFDGESTINSELVLFVKTTILENYELTDNAEIRQYEQTELMPITEYKKGKVDRNKN